MNAALIKNPQEQEEMLAAEQKLNSLKSGLLAKKGLERKELDNLLLTIESKFTQVDQGMI